MDASARREELQRIIKGRIRPVSATSLARQLGVSRQVIVGDVALLRASGCNIVSTARGYIMSEAVQQGRYLGKVACQHDLEGAVDELYTVVELGGEVLDVVVEHRLYGEMTGQLNLATPEDVQAFLDQVRNNETRLLSELTGGVHLHTIACRDAAHFELIRSALEKQGLLYREE